MKEEKKTKMMNKVTAKRQDPVKRLGNQKMMYVMILEWNRIEHGCVFITICLKYGKHYHNYKSDENTGNCHCSMSSKPEIYWKLFR